MAITITDGESGASTSNLGTYTTASWTPTADVLIIGTFTGARSATEPPTPSISGNGLTWVEITGLHLFWDQAGTRYSTYGFRAMGSSPTTGVTTIVWGADEQQQLCNWTILECTGVDTGGTNGSAAVGSIASVAPDSSATSHTVDISAETIEVGNTLAAFGGHQVQETVTFDTTGFTKLADVSNSGPSNQQYSGWRSSGTLEAHTVSWVGSNKHWGALVEIIAAPAAATGRPWERHHRRPISFRAHENTHRY